ncbi:MAG TPA: peptidoglycan DD-metalloendopeptidase family protein [Candidatus Eubacterium faecigallinarum]|nr:peptidoglycan DD-metalloendopeptidase family protein [Candidatus Eubacterium faecigallinarum]
MKRSKIFLGLMSVLLASCLFSASVVPQPIKAAAYEYSEDYESLSNEEKQAYLEQQLKEVNKKLDDLSEQSKDTEEYINTLDEKIRYMKNQLTLAEEGIESSKDKIDSLEKEYESNENKIVELEASIKTLTAQTAELQKKFDDSLVKYYQRIRAMYVSGNMTVLEALLTSDDVSTLLTRLEMIRRVSQNDKSLLETLQTQGEKLMSTKDDLSSQKTSLEVTQTTLEQTQKTLTSTIDSYEEQQVEYADKKQDYESQKSEADSLLLQLQQDTKNYSEFRHQDQEELDEINRQIEEAAEKYQQQMQQSTTTTTTTEKPESGGSSGDTKPNTTKPNTTKPSSNKLSMTYPVPSQTKITTAYGSAGYVGHTGVDFACASGSKVVAAESGTVIISTDLKNSDGSYRSYGRYIVIAHDKKDSAGNYVYTLYAHNSSRVVSEGQYVKKGQLIAYSGSTGNSSGPHCHFEVRTPTASYDDCVNPTYYLP